MRKVLAENIVIMGGTAMLAGFYPRLQGELQSLLERPHYRDSICIKQLRFHTPPAKPNYTAWLGGKFEYIS